MKKLLKIALFIEDIYVVISKDEKDKSQVYYRLHQRYADFTEKMTKTIVYVYGIIIFSFVFFIILQNVYLDLEETMYPIPIVIPGLDDHNAIKLIIIMTIGCVSLFLFGTILTAYDTLLFIVVANIPMVSTMIKGHLEDLQHVLELEQRHRNLNKIKLRVLNVLQMYLKYRK